MLNTNIVSYKVMRKRNGDSIFLVLVVLSMLTLIALNVVSAINHDTGYLTKTDVKTTFGHTNLGDTINQFIKEQQLQNNK
jgi:hypothetical protein